MTKIIASDGYVGITAFVTNFGEIIGVKTTLSNRTKKLYFTVKGRIYFMHNGIRYHLDNFIKTNYGEKDA